MFSQGCLCFHLGGPACFSALRLSEYERRGLVSCGLVCVILTHGGGIALVRRWVCRSRGAHHARDITRRNEKCGPLLVVHDAGYFQSLS